MISSPESSISIQREEEEGEKERIFMSRMKAKRITIATQRNHSSRTQERNQGKHTVACQHVYVCSVYLYEQE